MSPSIEISASLGGFSLSFLVVFLRNVRSIFYDVILGQRIQLLWVISILPWCANAL
jgi:hypothetical protein